MKARRCYATNARGLLHMREQGLMPASRVVVSLVGGRFDDVAAVTLHVRPDMPTELLDWQMLANLEVWLWAGPSAPLPWLQATASRIAHARPRELLLRFEEFGDIHDVEVGTGWHLAPVLNLPGQHYFDWVPINCSGSVVGARLRKALIDTHDRWSRM